MQQYIAEKPIITVIELDVKTPAGNDMVEVCYVDETREKMPKARFELIVSSEKSDAVEVLRKLEARVGALMFGTLHEYGIKWGEVNAMADAMVKFVESGYQKAHDLKWGTEKTLVTLIDIHNVLLEEHAKQNNNGASSTGGSVDPSN